MSDTEPNPVVETSQSPSFQFSLRMLLLLFVILAATLAVFGALGLVIFAVELWFAVRLRRAEPVGCAAFFVIGLAFLFLAIWPAVQVARDAGRQSNCSNKLRQLAMTLQFYRDSRHPFPPAYSVDNLGKPLLSWRVQTLPFYERGSLFKLFKFSEPWNGPTNKPLSTTQLSEFICPGDPESYQSGLAQTNYLAVVGSNAAWNSDKPRSDAEFHGEESNTIMLVEVANSGINWAEPRDLSVDALGDVDGKVPAIVPSSEHKEFAESSFFFCAHKFNSVNVAMVDGRLESLWLGGLSRDELRKVLQIGGCGPDVKSKLSEAPPRRLNWPNIAALAVWMLSVGTLLSCSARCYRYRRLSADVAVHHVLDGSTEDGIKDR
jgi:hypothetical protein